jgi:hypothetical protein
MRAMASEYTYKDFVERHLDEAAEVQREYGALANELKERGILDYTDQEGAFVSTFLNNSYIQVLAQTVKEYPGAPQDITAYYKGETTKAAKRYEEYIRSKFIKDLVTEVADQMVEDGVYEFVPGSDGKYIRPGPHYERFKQEMQDEGEG